MSKATKSVQKYRTRAVNLFALFSVAIALAGTFSATASCAQDQAPATPVATLAQALSAACRQDAAAFASFLIADSATAYRALPEPQRTEFMKRLVLLEDAGRPLLSTKPDGHTAIRCETPAITTEIRFGDARTRDNLSFVPIEIPVTGELSRSITFGLVREGGDWKLLSAGLILLDVPAMAKQWQEADLQTAQAAVQERENRAIAALHALATALETYRSAFGKLPETLAALGPASGGISPDAAGLVGAELAAGNADGYTIRYRILPAGGDLPESDANQAAKFELAATPNEYGKTGRRSFFLGADGTLRGGDKQGAVAISTDPGIGPA